MIMIVLVAVECFAKFFWVVVVLVHGRLAAARARLRALRRRLGQGHRLEEGLVGHLRTGEVQVRAHLRVVVLGASVASIRRVRDRLGGHVARRAVRRRAVQPSRARVPPRRALLPRRAGIRGLLVLLRVLPPLHEDAHANDNNDEYGGGDGGADDLGRRGRLRDVFRGVGFGIRECAFDLQEVVRCSKSVKDRAGVGAGSADAELVLAGRL